MTPWPVPGGLLERLGLPPGEVEELSRHRARELVSDRWRPEAAELAASLVYASGDPSLAEAIRIGGDPVARARRAISAGAGVLVDVGMVAAGVRIPAGLRLGVAIAHRDAAALAREGGGTRAAAGMCLGWEELGIGGVVGVGNAPSALLAVLDLAASVGPPACVVATCPGLHLAAEAKAALEASGLDFVAVAGSRGGSGLCAAALNALVSTGGVGCGLEERITSGSEDGRRP